MQQGWLLIYDDGKQTIRKDIPALQFVWQYSTKHTSGN
jgi:hypothetical protein